MPAAGSRGTAPTPPRNDPFTGPTGDNDRDLNLTEPTDDGPKTYGDKSSVKDDDKDAVYLIVATQRDGSLISELHPAETAEARVTGLTWGSKQHLKEHRKAVDDQEAALPEGGGSHEIDRKDVRVYKLATSLITDF